MPRVDRVMDLLELLRGRDVCAVEALARELQVSRRTVLRDLATLRGRGWPIRSEAGPGGGVFLDRDRGVTAVHLSLDELVGLWVTARLAGSATALPWSAAARAALDKVLASVPRERARGLRQLLRRVVVGAPATERVRATLGTGSPELLVAFERAFGASRCLAFEYVDRHGRASARLVEPHGLLVEPPAWYLLTRDTSTGLARAFRMDRVRGARLSARTFTPDFEGLQAQHDAQRAQEAAARGGAPGLHAGPPSARNAAP